MNDQKGLTNIIVAIVAVMIVGAVGYTALVKKSEPITQKPTTAQQLSTTGHIAAFEAAVNMSDFSTASTYFSDKVNVVLEGSECCGEVTANRAQQALEGMKGLVFTFNPNDALVKEYMTAIASQYPDRRLINTTPKVYFDELSIGVESDTAQKNKASIGYKVSNNKITDLFINAGRDR